MRPITLFAAVIGLFALVWPLNAQDVPAGPQELPAAPWYTVFFNETKGQLVWINGDGVQARTNFVSSPGSVGDPKNRDVAISPNGHYGIFRDTLTDGRLSLVFYNFETARPVKTYLADPGEETILGLSFLGGSHGFTLDSTRFVAVFYLYRDNIMEWRLVEFDLTTGEVLHTLKRTDVSLDIQTEIPPIVYFASTSGDSYQFATTLDVTPSGTSLEAYRWTPADNGVSSLGLLSRHADILAESGRRLEAFNDGRRMAIMPPDTLPLFNVIAQRTAFDAPQEMLAQTQTATLLYPTWAAGGTWIAYQIIGQDKIRWATRPLDVDVTYTHPEPLPLWIAGASDGYVVSYDGKVFSASAKIDGTDEHVIYETPEGDEGRVVYITPQEQTFAAMTLGYRPAREVPTAVPTDTACSGAAVSRLAVGVTARTVASPAGIRGAALYTEPNQNMTFGIGFGTEFVISDGPVCAGNALWWKTTVTSGANTSTGWMREAEQDVYYLEPVP